MKQQARKNWGTMVLGAFITVALTILNTLLIDYCTARKNSLSYYVRASEPIEKDSVQWRIYSMDLLNDGDAAAEDIKGLIQFRNQRIAAFKLHGSPTLSIQDSLLASAYHIKVASLNPAEKLAMAFLVSGTPAGGTLPLADFRAKGLSAVGRTSTGWRGRPLPLYAVLLLAGATCATLCSFGINGLLAKKRQAA